MEAAVAAAAVERQVALSDSRELSVAIPGVAQLQAEIGGSQYTRPAAILGSQYTRPAAVHAQRAVRQQTSRPASHAAAPASAAAASAAAAAATAAAAAAAAAAASASASSAAAPESVSGVAAVGTSQSTQLAGPALNLDAAADMAAAAATAAASAAASVAVNAAAGALESVNPELVKLGRMVMTDQGGCLNSLPSMSHQSSFMAASAHQRISASAHQLMS